MGVRLLSFGAVLGFAGCCLAIDSGGEGRLATATSGGSSSSGGQSGGSSSSGGQSGGSSSSGSQSGGSVSGAVATGTGTGSLSPLHGPTFLLDAGPRQVFGPIALASMPQPGAAGAASLVYSIGNGGGAQALITEQVLADDGRALGVPILISLTSSGLPTTPHVAVSSDGNATTVCWEDYGSSSNPYGCFQSPETGGLVRCGTLDATQTIPDGGYSNCGRLPELVRNPTTNETRLGLFTDEGLEFWEVGQRDGCSVGGNYVTAFAIVPVSVATDAYMGFDGQRLLAVAEAYELSEDDAFCSGGFYGGPFAYLDDAFSSDGRFAAAGDLTSATLGVLAMEDAGLEVIAWQIDAGPGPWISIEPPAALSGVMAATTCPAAFTYFAMTTSGALFLVEQAFDGTLIQPSRTPLPLPGFSSTVTSMAAVPAPDGGLFVAVSSVAQIAVYRVDCP